MLKERTTTRLSSRTSTILYCVFCLRCTAPSVIVALSLHDPRPISLLFVYFFFNDTATTEIYTLSLHDALPICRGPFHGRRCAGIGWPLRRSRRSEEHTSELQSPCNLVCRLLLEKKKKTKN